MRVGLYSSLLLIAIAPLSVFIHEEGHLIICASEGHTYTMSIGIFGGVLHCSGALSNPLLFFAFGGVFAGIVLSGPFIAWKKINQYPFLVIPLVSLISGHLVNAAVETFLSRWYFDNMAEASIIINAIVAAIFLATWIKTS